MPASLMILRLTICGFFGAVILSRAIGGPIQALIASLAFGVCDGLAALLSTAAAPYYPFAELAAIVAFAGLYACHPTRRAAAAALVPLLSLGCLAAGTPAEAPQLCAAGSLMALIGFSVGRLAFQRGPRRYEAMPIIAAMVLLH